MAVPACGCKGGDEELAEPSRVASVTNTPSLCHSSAPLRPRIIAAAAAPPQRLTQHANGEQQRPDLACRRRPPLPLAALQIEPAVPSPSPPSRAPMEEPQQQQQQQVAPVKKRVKPMRKSLDHYNVIQALPAMFPFPPKKMEPHAAGKKRVATDENTTGGPSRNNKKPKAASAPKDAPTKGRPRASGKKSVATNENTTGGLSTTNKNRKAARAPKDSATKGRPRTSGKKMVATDQNTTGGPSTKKAARAPKDSPTKGRPRASGNKRVATDENTTGGPSSKSKNRKAARAPNDAPTEGHLGSVVDISNGANNEHHIQEEQTGNIVAHRTRDIPNIDVEAGTVQLDNPANAECILEEDPIVQQPNDINNQQIIEQQAGVENQENVAVNQQHLPDEQAGIMQQQNFQNAIEENVPEDPAVFADIFNFPLNNELIDLPKIEDILEDPTGVENEQNIINNQQHIPDQQAGIVQQQNPAENAAEDDPTVFGDIFDFPLNNQLMDLDRYGGRHSQSPRELYR
ncbi:uncharacterized protein [Miscanthus floridulus]|uniref:uncharacterized protein n=1 Tax=Miscanthus floridulus TaxID=154761 RepID=UPI00345B33A4